MRANLAVSFATFQALNDAVGVGLQYFHGGLGRFEGHEWHRENIPAGYSVRRCLAIDGRPAIASAFDSNCLISNSAAVGMAAYRLSTKRCVSTAIIVLRFASVSSCVGYLCPPGER